eukprot:CAMPEP_0119128756 /NCGR_PEP_ID=MMETSP1310-20130426/6783_1 /TAXON_ID=464262 /ORGANISM="Genus nov. species nov., Strain RCC2339" /LENGTH=511 /DNA_ID=CAMNT_0007119127 /DNA_START=95 /DNA_END=1627 /DNA_ORIENTATION=+
MTTLPNSLANLAQNVSLLFGHNHFTELPASISGMTNLQQLALNNNNFTSHRAITFPSSLLALSVGSNTPPLTQPPPNLGRLTGLLWLELQGNALTAVPSLKKSQIQQMLDLFLEDNAIRQAPGSLNPFGEASSGAPFNITQQCYLNNTGISCRALREDSECCASCEGSVGALPCKRSYQFWFPLGQVIAGPDPSIPFPSDVAISANGRTVALGFPDDILGGSVGVYQYSNRERQWSLLGPAIRPSSSEALFGAAVALSNNGKKLLVGNFDHDSSRGQAILYEFRQGDWMEMDQVVGSTPGGLLGWAVAISGNGKTWAAGAPGAGDDEEGLVLIKDRNGDTTFFGPSEESSLGISVAMSKNGKTVATFNQADSVVQVFQLVRGAWSAGPNVTGLPPGGYRSLALSANGKTLAAGNQVDTNATVFELRSGAWERLGGDLHGPDSFGRSVGLSNNGKTLAVGAPGADSSAGMVSIFNFRRGSWTQDGEANFTGSSGQQALGSALAMSSNGRTVV